MNKRFTSILLAAFASSLIACSGERPDRPKANTHIHHLEFTSDGELGGYVSNTARSGFFVSVDTAGESLEARELTPFFSGKYDGVEVVGGSTIDKVIWAVSQRDARHKEYYAHPANENSSHELVPRVTGESEDARIVAVFSDANLMLVDRFYEGDIQENIYELWDIDGDSKRASLSITDEDFLWPSGVSPLFGPSLSHFVIAFRVVPSPSSNHAVYTRLDLFSIDPFERLDTASVDGLFYHLGIGPNSNEVRLVTNTPELVSAKIRFETPSSKPTLKTESVHSNGYPWAYMCDLIWGGNLAVVRFEEIPGQLFPPRLPEPEQMMALNALEIDEEKPWGGSGVVVPDFVAANGDWGFNVNKVGNRIVAWDGSDTVYLWQVDHPTVTLESKFRFIFVEETGNLAVVSGDI